LVVPHPVGASGGLLGQEAIDLLLVSEVRQVQQQVLAVAFLTDLTSTPFVGRQIAPYLFGEPVGLPPGGAF
jgi:hypothetical protein